MSEHLVKKLGVVDGEKLNSLINLLHKEKSENKILRDATDTPEEVGLIESYGKMKDSVKRNSSLAGLSKEQFLKKKQKYKESISNKENEEEEQAEQQQQQQYKPGSKGDANIIF